MYTLHPKGGTSSLLLNLSTILPFFFYLKIVHSNSIALSFQQYMCICTCIAANLHFAPPILCK